MDGRPLLGEYTVRIAINNSRKTNLDRLHDNYSTNNSRWIKARSDQRRTNTRQFWNSWTLTGPNKWALKACKYIKMGHAPEVDAKELNDWDLRNGKTILNRLTAAHDGDNKWCEPLKTTRVPRTATAWKYTGRNLQNKLSTRYILVFYGDWFIVPKNLRTTVINHLHEGHPARNKMTTAARHFWWPPNTEAIQKKFASCVPCKMSDKNIKPKIPSTEKNQLPMLSKPNEEIQLDFIVPII